jgi:hypothetical protein
MIGNYIKAAKAFLTSAKLMKTGQTTSYRTGDDGDLEVGRNVDFFTLAENNPFGTTDRFTDELGGSTYTDNIVIDWSTFDGSTVLGWYRLRGTYNDFNWNDAIDNSLLFSIGTYTTGWRLPNIKELYSLTNLALSYPFSYFPLNFTVDANFWSSTTNPGVTSNAMTFRNYQAGQISSRIKTNTAISYRAIPCRTFTVTGTTLS